MKKKLLFFVLFVASTFSIRSLSIDIRSYDHEAFSRIVFEGNQGFSYKFDPSETAIEITLNQKAKIKNNINVFDSVLIDRVVHHWEEDNSVFRVHLKSDFEIMRNFVLEQPFRVVFDLTKLPGKKQIKKVTLPPRKSKPKNRLKNKRRKEKTTPRRNPGKRKHTI